MIAKREGGKELALPSLEASLKSHVTTYISLTWQISTGPHLLPRRLGQEGGSGPVTKVEGRLDTGKSSTEDASGSSNKGKVLSLLGFPGGSDGKEFTCSAGDTRGVGSVPGWGRSSGEGNGNPLQYSCPENSTERGAWWATVHGVSKSQTD